MWKNQIEYFADLSEEKVLVKISFLHINRLCTGYIRVVNEDGVFMSTEMGDDQRVSKMDLTYIPFAAISLVEQGP
jgi:hypothetical protein